MKFKLGRKSRGYDSKIMHMSALMMKKQLPAPPENVDWTKGMKEFGVMKNDQLGCCTISGTYHARQIWTANVLTEKTETDDCVLKLYEEACGYKPGDSSTDNGGVEQDVLKFIMNTGIPLSDGSRDKIIGFIEVDPRNQTDVKICINDFGLAYIGFEVPNSIYDETGEPKQTWDYDPEHTEVEGGHCIILVGYSDIGPIAISWGSIYQLTWSFFSAYTDEVYAIISPDWIASTGKDPLGMTVLELEDLMQGIKQ